MSLIGHHVYSKFVLYMFISVCIHHASSHLTSDPITEEERLSLKEEAREMFYHAYNAYMANAYPADELLPLSCAGRYRDLRYSRGDIDDVLGNFSLTLVDTLDSLVILGDLTEFENAVKLIIRDVTFDTDVTVSVFETNIRMVGGLLSGHVLSEHLNQLYGIMSWYKGELLVMAQDIATRLLPAFNTTTGIPHPRVNLRHGMRPLSLANSRDTCTSCAGTMILEFAALSRLTGHPVFEEKARQTMDYLWQQRHRGSDLVGTVLNIHSGDWVRRDSGVGAGIDSYYEYLLKAHVLLGDSDYLHRFNTHYNAVMKYVSQGPMLLDVHMHRPHTTTRNFMDAFLAFWPGLQVLKGDIKPAIETHEMLYQVIQRHNFLPEAFTTDFQVHWGQHPLRPEFVESTYLLYEATEDPYYLRIGRETLRALQRHAWVPCGYAAVKDVRTGEHEDRMDSFVLSETFKYLYLLFSKPSELPINLDDFVFTTEAHLLPLSLARMPNMTTKGTAVPLLDSEDSPASMESDVEFYRSCPNAHSLFPGKQQFAENIRKPLKNYVDSVCPNRHRALYKRKLRAVDFQSGNAAHIELVRDMGITVQGLADGRVHLLHSSTSAASPDDSEEGLLFMQEMIELSKAQQEQPDNPPKAVIFAVPKRAKHSDSASPTSNSSDDQKDGSSSVGNDDDSDTVMVKTLTAGPAQFGLQLKKDVMVEGTLVVAEPYRACESLTNAAEVKGNIVLLERGDCMFIDKARIIQKLGAAGGIVVDNGVAFPLNDDETSYSTNTSGKEEDHPPLFAMSGDNSPDDVTIPLVFLFAATARELLSAHRQAEGKLSVLLADLPNRGKNKKAAKEFVLSVDEKKKADKASLVKSYLQSKAKEYHGVKGEESCSDDLVTLVAEATKEAEALEQNGGDAGEVLLPDEVAVLVAGSADDVVTALEEFVQRQQQRDDGGDQSQFLLQRVKNLLARKGQRNPLVLRSLLSSHITHLMRILETCITDTPSSSSTPAVVEETKDEVEPKVTGDAAAAGGLLKEKLNRPKLVDEVVMSLLEVLVIHSIREQGGDKDEVGKGTVEELLSEEDGAAVDTIIGPDGDKVQTRVREGDALRGVGDNDDHDEKVTPKTQEGKPGSEQSIIGSETVTIMRTVPPSTPDGPPVAPTASISGPEHASRVPKPANPVADQTQSNKDEHESKEEL